ncbi:MAG: mucoidy inhibitor MuiA family protein [Rhodobacteraceae bacterium]|nr:mucoidy inhibitor MuiA family protein [Paracoccaceae bacterium]
MFPNFTTRSILTLTCLAGSALITLPAYAERFEARSLVTEATLYPAGAMITREATVSLPEGQHEIVFADIPMSHSYEQVVQGMQIRVDGGALGPVAYGIAEISKALLIRSEAEKAALARVEELEDEIDDRRAEIAQIGFEAEAAKDTLAYLARLSDGSDAEQSAATARMIREESLAARLAQQDAEHRAKAAKEAMEDLEADLAEATKALERLVPSDENRVSITLPVTMEQAGEVEISFTYMSDAAAWEPRYAARLNTEDNTLSLTRSVVAMQDTGELWTDVALTFATDDPTRRSFPQDVYPLIRRVYEPRPVEPLMRTMASDAMEGGYAEPVMEAPVMVEKMNTTLSGLSQTYSYPTPATLYSGEDAVEFALATVDLSPEIFVRAVPLHEEVGYLMASFANETGEMLVPGSVQLIRDGVSLGEARLDTMVDGAEAELAFGPVDGITVERVLLTRNEGDRGVISKSNETETEWRIEVANLTARSWPVEVLDRVSVSEQDELKVDWSASPSPDVEGVDDKRGVLAWHFDLEAGDSQEISLSENLRWPEGKSLQ